MNVFVFDIETVPDVAGGRLLYQLEDNLSFKPLKIELIWTLIGLQEKYHKRLLMKLLLIKLKPLHGEV